MSAPGTATGGAFFGEFGLSFLIFSAPSNGHKVDALKHIQHRSSASVFILIGAGIPGAKASQMGMEAGTSPTKGRLSP